MWGSTGESAASSSRVARSARSYRRGNATTRSAQLRANVIKLTCHLNCEGRGGMATTVKLPEDCDTLEEVLIKVQARMQLDSRMLYASELYDVHGTPVRNMRDMTFGDHVSLQGLVSLGLGFGFNVKGLGFRF